MRIAVVLLAEMQRLIRVDPLRDPQGGPAHDRLNQRMPRTHHTIGLTGTPRSAK